MKKAISILLVLCMAMGFVPAYAETTAEEDGFSREQSYIEALVTNAVADNPAPVSYSASTATSGQCGDNVYWSFDEATGTLTISGTGEMWDYSPFEESSTWYALKSDIENIILDAAVTSIGSYAFCNCSGLTSMYIPDSVTSIRDGAFSGCGGLASINIPDSVTSIGKSAFSNCIRLKNISIPDGVTSIERNTFVECRSLTSINIPYSVTSIEDEAFGGCSSLTSVTLPTSVISIESWAFYDCRNLRSISIPNSVTSIGKYAFRGCSSLTSIIISDGIISIEDSAFYDCRSLRSISIPNSVTSIGKYAFSDCDDLTSINIPSSVTSIEVSAFRGCDSLGIVYYSGSQASWDAIDLDSGNEDLQNANIIFAEPTPEDYETGNGTDPEISALHIVDVSDEDIIIGDSNEIRAVFNKDITIADTSKSISIWELETGRMFTLFFVNNPNVNIINNVLSIDLSDFDLYSGRTYYVRIQSGAIKSTDGDFFFGLTDNTTWRFTMPRDLRVSGIAYGWDKKWYGGEDKSKPPVPNGTDDQYAQLLRNWTWSMGWELEINDALELLDYPAYLPVTDVNNQPILLNDNATTVRQVIEDIVFVSELQSYIDDLDNELEDITPSTEAESAWWIIAEILGQETEAYETAARWYEQIDRYLSGRAEDSNFFLSLGAPIAYQVLTQTIGKAKVGTIGKAYLDTLINETALQTVDGAEKYDEFKSTVKDIGNIGKGTAAAYTALMNGETNKVIKFSTNLLADYLAKSDNEMLSDIATAYKDLNKVIPAVKLCMFLGSTAGMFPMVIDLYNDLTRSRYDQVKAAYFIANYYIIEKDPTLYDTIMSLDDGRIHSRSYVWEKFTDDAFDYQMALEEAEQSGDPIIENWARFINSGRMADVDEVDSSLLWRNIASYATILRFAKFINVNDTIVALIDYLQSEGQAPATTGISVSCPVRVNIYDMGGNIVASLSSEDDEIADCEYGTMYLLGENGETKYFLLNSEDYRIEIVPYADGTMDVSITNSNEDGTAEGVYYEDVELRTGMTITTDSLVEDSSSLEVNEGEISSSITPEDEIPVTGISVDAPSKLAVGESVTLDATIAPATATEQSVSWKSSNPDIVDVSGVGVITAKAAGDAEITATVGGVSQSVGISAYLPAESITLDVDSVTMCAGEELPVSASVYPSNATHDVQWSSSAGSVAMVDENGCINALSEGMAMLTAEVDGAEAYINVTVYEQPVNVIIYQSDTNGDRIKVDILNGSLYTNFTGSVFVALYDGAGRMVTVTELPAALSAGTYVTSYVPVDGLDSYDGLQAKAFAVNGQMAPVSVSVSMLLIA